MVEKITPAAGPSILYEILSVPQAEIGAMYPSAQAAVDLARDIGRVSTETLGKKRYQSGEEIDAASEDTSPGSQKFTRDMLRMGKDVAGIEAVELGYASAHFIASFDDTTAGEQAAKKILNAEIAPLFYENCATQLDMLVAHIHSFRSLASQAKTEIEAIRAADAGANYHLLKSFATDVGTEVRQARRMTPTEDWRQGHMLARLAVLGEMRVQQELAAETVQGTFDDHIAKDLLHAAQTTESQHLDLRRLREFSSFVMLMAGVEQGDTAFLDHMASQFEQWPAGERNVIVQTRDVLLRGLSTNFTVATQRLTEARFLGNDDERKTFELAIANLMTALLRGIEMDLVPPHDKTRILRLKAKYGKRGGPAGTVPRRKDLRADQAADEVAALTAAANPETPPEQPKLVTYDIVDSTTKDGIDELVAKFIRGGPGSPLVLEEVQQSLEFFVRADLPAAYRDGKHKLEDCGVRFGKEVVPLWEYKPLAAAGLSLRSKYVKAMRVYYIKLPDENAYGVVGIEPRAKQVEFLKNLRARTKRA